MKIQNSFPLQQSQEAKLKKQDEALRDASKMYESHFMNAMVKAMRSTTGKTDGIIKQNFAEKIFTEQLDHEYVEGWSKKGGVGLADLVYNQIRERYFGTAKKDFGKAPGALPIAPKNDGGMKATDSIQMKSIPINDGAKLEYRFEVQDPTGGGAGSTGAGHEAVSPMAGTVTKAQSLGDGWNLVRLDHGQGLQSELTFPGSMTEMSDGIELDTGQRLGQLDPKRPVLAWKLDWS
jgi:flagellar protein FlgJ